MPAKLSLTEAMSFLRHKEIYQSDDRKRQRARLGSHARAHRLDEFPVGYSWRVALQQGPLPLRQPPPIVQKNSQFSQALFSDWTKARKERKNLSLFSPQRYSPLAGFEVTTIGRF